MMIDTAAHPGDDIMDVNQQIISNMLDIIKRLAQDPEAEIAPIVQTIQYQSNIRNARIKRKRLVARNACERFERKEVG